jgi:leucine-zipper of insertion element IS481/Integrase core domain
MKLHGNARTCPGSRRLLVERVVEQRWALAAAAEAAAVSARTAWKWLARLRAEGEAGLVDRSSRPHCSPSRTPLERMEAIATLRRLRFTAAEISQTLRMPLSTVSAVLGRVGLGKLSRLEPPEPANRYQRRHPGELVHVDVKKLARIDGAGHRAHGNRGRQKRRRGTNRIGYEYVHVCVDDATRLAHVEVLADEKARTAVGFLRRARIWYRRHGVRIRRVMTDNGACYVSALHALACRRLDVKHLRTPPTPPTHQRKGRAHHPHHAGRLGIRRHLRHLQRTHRRPPRLAPHLQSHPTTRQPRPPTTHTPLTGPHREQRP